MLVRAVFSSYSRLLMGAVLAAAAIALAGCNDTVAQKAERPRPVLVAAVQRITSMLRSYDSLGRYGGEEFLLIAPGCDLDLAQKLAERIRTAIGDETIDLGEDAIKVSVSLGVTLGTADSDPEFLVALADAALYRAKHNGRDRVEIGLELPEDEPIEMKL